MTNHKISYRYAKTLLELAIENKHLKQTFEDIQFLDETIENSKDFYLLLNSPILKKQTKEKCIVQILKHYQYPQAEVMTPFIQLLLKKNREKLLPSICKQFRELYYRHEGICISKLTTAKNPSPKVLTEIKKLLEKVSKSKKQIVDKIIDESIIGGYILEFEDKVLDSSIRRKLNNLRLNITE